MRKIVLVAAALAVACLATAGAQGFNPNPPSVEPNFIVAPDMDGDYVEAVEILNPFFVGTDKGDQLKLIVCETEHEERCFGPMSWWEGQQIAVAYQDAGVVFLVEGDQYYKDAFAEELLSYADAWETAPDQQEVTKASAN